MAERFVYEHAADTTRSHETRDGVTRFEASQECEAILRHCRAQRERLGRHTHGRDLVALAEVPLVVYERAVREGWSQDPAAWRRWLSDPDNRAFRIWEGRHR